MDNEAQRASSGGPTLLNFHTSPFVHRKYMNGRLRPPAAAAAAAVRHAAARHAAVRHAACLRRREESNDRCFVSSLTLLMATASGRVATPISSAPARRTLQTTKVPRVEASTSTTMSRTRRRPAAVRHAACLRRREESNNRRKRSRESSRPWSVAKRCPANDGEGDLFLVLTTTVDVTLLLANGIGPSAMNRRHWR